MLVISYLILDLSFNSRINTEDFEILDSEELSSFLRNLGDRNGKIAVSDKESGAVVHRYMKSNIYLIPKQTNPRHGTEEAKAVLSHEFSHVKNNDKIVSVLTDILFVISNGFLLLTPIFIFILVFVLNCIVIFPIFKNYLNHKFEYRADKFAVENSSLNAVLKRLRRNSHLSPNPSDYIPYDTTHPSIQNRIERIYNEKDISENSRSKNWEL